MIRLEITQASRARFLANLKAYEKRAGKSREETTIGLAKASAKQLASKIQPYGVSARIGKKFEESIKTQVWRAIKNAQIKGDTSGVRTAHSNRRNSRGRVSRQLDTAGKYAMAPYDAGEVANHAAKKSAQAGLLKSAWISAGNKLKGNRISGVAKWITRHTVSHGASKISNNLNGVSVYLTNRLDYIRKAQKNSEIQSALKTAYNGYSYFMKREIEKSHTAKI